MDVAGLVIQLAEKMGLLAAAALVAVLFPPLRNRVLGLGRRRDKAAALVFGLVLSIWGATLGFRVVGEHINVRAIGVLIAAILGGKKAGALAGFGGGLFYAAHVEPTAAPWVLSASVIDGVLAGLVASRAPYFFTGWRTFATSLVIQAIHLILVGVGLLVVGNAARYVPAWPAHLVKILVNSAGVTLFVVVARLVVSREEAAVALVEAQARAHASALEVLRRRLEPHFLFNALNVLRATIRTDPTRARDLVSDLADLYRYLLSHPNEARVRDEVSHACAYLAIERARLGDDRLAVETDISEEAQDISIPALLLQPLVENAVKHGVAARAGAGTVRIRAHLATRQGLRIEVEDRTRGEPTGPARGGAGIALETLRARLRQRYGAAASFELESTRQGMRAIVRLPVVASPAAVALDDQSMGDKTAA